MSNRRSHGLSTFFPERYGTPDDLDNSSPRHKNGRPFSRHKELYVPSSASASASSSRFSPSTHNRPYEGKYSRKYNTPPKKRPFSNYNNNSTTPRSDFSETNSTPLTSPPKTLQTSNNIENDSKPEIIWPTGVHSDVLNECSCFDSKGKLRPEVNVSQASKSSFKAIYDPELSKDKSKGSKIIYKKETEHKHSKDPRLEPSFKKQLSTMKRLSKFPFKSLPLPKFTYDKHSVGPPPPTEVIISGLGNEIANIYLINQLKSIGTVIETESLLDPSSGVPLGILRVRFGDSQDKAHEACRKAIKDLHHTNIGSNNISVVMKKNEEVLQQIINKAIGSTVTKIKLNELEKNKAVLPSAPKSVLKAIARHGGPKDAKSAREARIAKFAALAEAREAAIAAIKAKEAASKKLVDSDNNLVKVPDALEKLIKGRPFLFIASKYIKNKLSKNDIKKALETYDWTRVITDDLGVFIVFNSPKEAKRCFHFEDGKPVFSVNLYMKLQLPEGYQSTKEDDDYTLEERDVLVEATSLLTKEFEDALQKDIRTKIIAPAILDFLNIDNFPELKAQILPPTPPISEKKEEESSVEPVDAPLDVFSLQVKPPKLPSFKKKSSSAQSLKDKIISPKKRKLLPLNYKLNFQDDTDNENASSRNTTPQPKEEGPVKKKAKKSSEHNEVKQEEDEDEDDDQEVENADDDIEEDEEMEYKRKREPLLYSSSSEDEEESHEAIKESIPTTPEDDKMDIDIEKPQEEVDHSIFDRLHQPISSEIPIPVYEEDPDDLLLDIEGFQKVVKDEEDFELLRELLKDEPESPLSYPADYWCWKSKTLKAERELNTQDSTIEIPADLENSTGSYRSQGYTKISDEVKVGYLPHRKRVHDPLSTIQVDNEDAESSKVQSSRANRSNNRRFAYEVSNFNTENEILTMNQLNKRKKPVSFARSAIHNWGLYALEPIAEREMIIEYVGERIRQQVADFREKAYLKSGIGSSYLFRVDENTVIDATKKGGIARFINHSCVPSCTAKIIKVEGQKRIVIYALRDIATNEELTYDYKFERETNDQERVRCLCGAPGCKGYLN